MKTILLTLSLSFGIIGCNNSTKISQEQFPIESVAEFDTIQDSDIPQVVQQIAESNGFNNWNEVSEIAFTFNVDRKGNYFERSWIWKTKTQDVQMISAEDTVNYNRSNMDSLAIKADASFINDKYWLLAPFQLLWDEKLAYSIQENAVAPISKDTLGKLTVVYPSEGGYTPGDAYDFFYDKNHIIREWNYRKGNALEPSMSTTWEDYQSFEGIDIATMHSDKTGDFKLYFTDISIKKNIQN